MAGGAGTALARIESECGFQVRPGIVRLTLSRGDLGEADMRANQTGIEFQGLSKGVRSILQLADLEVRISRQHMGLRQHWIQLYRLVEGIQGLPCLILLQQDVPQHDIGHR